LTGNFLPPERVFRPKRDAIIAPKPEIVATTTARICDKDETEPRTNSGEGIAYAAVGATDKNAAIDAKQIQILTVWAIQGGKNGVLTGSPSERKGNLMEVLGCVIETSHSFPEG
jgi:hypothetical protein